MYAYVFVIATLVVFPPCNADEDALRPVQVICNGNADAPNVLHPRPDPAASGPPGKRGPPGQPGPKGDQGPPGIMGNAEISDLGFKDEFDSLKAKIQQMSNRVNANSNQTYSELGEKLQQILDIVNGNPAQIIENIDTKIESMSDKFDAVNDKLEALENALLSTNNNMLTSLVTTTTAKDSTQTTSSTGRYPIVHCGLGLADGRVKNNQITSSADHGSTFHKYNVRLNGRKASWMKQGGWIQFDFQKPVNISGLISKGDFSASYWTTSFKVLYGLNEKSMKYIEDHNGHEVFYGNRNNYEPRITYFMPVISARYLRVMPITYNSYPSLRMEVLTPTDLQSEESQNLPKGAICTYKKVQLLVG